jgi:hypothetical protein
MVQQTMSALRSSGTWSRWKAPTAVPVDPYSRIDRILARGDTTRPSGPLRDPFEYGRASASVAVSRPRSERVVVPVRRPSLTAIIWDNDPRASIRWNDRDYSVRVNTLFDEYRVKSISRDQLVLEREGESIVLRLSKKGE